MVNSTMDWLLGNERCELCRTPAFAAGLCARCIDALPWNEMACARCALPLQTASPSCRQCRALGDVADAVVGAFRYEPPIDRWIHALKYEAALPAGRRLGLLLAQRIRSDGGALPELVLPVPLHRNRLRERGYNQATEIARWLATDLALPLRSDATERLRDTADQTHLSATERRRNLRAAFAADPSIVQGRHVALVDDVMTTGASARALAGALRQAGAARVLVWCAARTPLP